MKGPVRVLIADRAVLVREGLRAILTAEEGMVVIGVATEGAEALRLCREDQPDVLLLDLNIPRLPFLELMALLQGAFSRTKVIALVDNYDDRLPALVRAGITGCLVKDEPREKFLKRNSACLQGPSRV